MKNCPNPKCNNEDIRIGADYPSTSWSLWCKACYLQGPYAKTETEAKELWDALPRMEDIQKLQDLIAEERDYHGAEIRMLKADSQKLQSKIDEFIYGETGGEPYPPRDDF